MATVFIAFIVMLITVAALAVGVMMGRKPIGGSCGGMAAVGVTGSCSCGRGKPGSCATDGAPKAQASEAQFVDASKK